jgi:hypothetical protein
MQEHVPVIREVVLCDHHDIFGPLISGLLEVLKWVGLALVVLVAIYALLGAQERKGIPVVRFHIDVATPSLDELLATNNNHCIF